RPGCRSRGVGNRCASWSARCCRGTVKALDPAVRAAYNAPFPDESYQAGARQFPLLVPITPFDEAAEANRRAWTTLTTLDLPFLCAFSDKDYKVGNGERSFQENFPGARGQKHITIDAAGHFVQEDKGPQLAEVVESFIRSI
ncbi:hypothetical protein ACW9HO_38875, partial [Nocardia gipuzkoensis]